MLKSLEKCQISQDSTIKDKKGALDNTCKCILFKQLNAFPLNLSDCPVCTAGEIDSQSLLIPN